MTLRRYADARGHYLNGRIEEALPILLAIHRETPTFTGASFMLGRIYFFKEQYPLAADYWSKTLETNPHHIDSRKWLARLRLLENRPDLAEELLLPALAESSEDPELLLLMAKTRRDQGDLGDAIELYTKTQLFGQRLADASLDLAEIYQDFGLPNRSREELEQALQWVGAQSALAPAIRALLESLRQENEQ